jgi:hypothetical protein
MRNDESSPTTLYTSAPEAYDGFGTTTLKVVGGCNQSRNPVRLVQVEPEHREWQTARYDSGCCRYTGERIRLADFVRFGDWTLTSQERRQ